MADFADKVTDDDKAPIQAKIDGLKEALKTDNTDDIKAKTDELQKAIQEISTKVYQQSAPQQDGNAQQPNPEDFSNADDGVVDADYTEV